MENLEVDDMNETLAEVAVLDAQKSKTKGPGNGLSVGLGVGAIIAVALLILSASIALPIWFRPFYYAHIDAMGLTDTGSTRREIMDAYNAMINFCTLFMPIKESPEGNGYLFGTLACSASGKSHFEDVRTLFLIDDVVLLISLIYLVVYVVLKKKKVVEPLHFKKRSVKFYGGLSALGIVLILGIAVAIDFEKAFEVFHKIFFPGKENWMFDPSVDEIIRVMPQQFFANCAIFIGAGILISSGLCIGLDFVKRKKASQSA